MKKSMSFIAALALASTIVSAIPASAANTVDIEYTVVDAYTIVIPDSTVTLNSEKTIIDVEAQGVIVGSQKQLKVSVAGENEAWEMVDKADAENTLAYTVSKVTLEDDEITSSEPVAVNGAIINVDAGNAAVKLNIVPGTPVNAGTYSDTLTFTAGIVDKD